MTVFHFLTVAWKKVVFFLFSKNLKLLGEKIFGHPHIFSDD